MMNIIRADQRYSKDMGWLKTYWLFSFSNYNDPSNVNFGKLRVFNDDVVAPGGGFPTHSHDEMEIITIVLDGEITHEDSMGNRSVVRAGNVQGMTAGTGLSHSEFNGSDKPLWLYQIWIYPDSRELKPGYDQKDFKLSSFKNHLLPVASGQGITDAVKIHADATIYRSSLDADHEIDFKTDQERKIFLYVTSGNLVANNEMLHGGDQARIEHENHLNIKTDSHSEFILIDVMA
jgi:redox-sensitive bicupin YhaK (pirin superfamily)